MSRITRLAIAHSLSTIFASLKRGKGIAELGAAFAELRFESRDKQSVFATDVFQSWQTPAETNSLTGWADFGLNRQTT